MQNRYHILLLTSSYPASTMDSRASAGLFVKDFAHELSKRVKVTVLTQKTGSGPETVFESGIKVIRFPWANIDHPLSTLRFPKDIHLIFWVILGGMWAALKFSRLNRVNIAFALWAIPSGIWALPLKWIQGIPFVVWCLGSDIWDYGKKPILNKILLLILKQAKTRFADGYRLKNDVKALSGRDCQFLPSTRRLPLNPSIKSGTIPGKRNYLFIGRYHFNKGPDILIEAIALLPPEIKEQVHFHLFGGGPMEESLKHEIKKKNLTDVVSLNSYIDEKNAAAYLRACDALIVPSRIESIPVMLSDALQSCCPLIVTDVGDMGDLVKKYKAGQVVQQESPEELKKAILRDFSVGSDKYDEGLVRLLKLFDLRTSVAIFLEHVIWPCRTFL